MKITSLPTPSSFTRRLDTDNRDIKIFVGYLSTEMRNESAIEKAKSPGGHYTFSVRRPFYRAYREEMDKILAHYGWKIVSVQVYEDTKVACPSIVLRPLSAEGVSNDIDS